MKDRAPARERILAEAERMFGAHGFDGVSIRQLAIASNVSLALVSYHFGSKEGVYRAVIALRAPTVIKQATAGLAIAASERDLDRRLELVVKALVFPLLRLRANDSDRHFGQLLAREVIDPSCEQRGAIRETFDSFARAVVDALRAALPERAEAELWWAYEFMLGVVVFTICDVGQLARLTGGCCRPGDEGTAGAQLVAFLTAGVRYGRALDLPDSNVRIKTTERRRATPPDRKAST